jgi:ATP-dependent Clp protease ATP-binding subunit ClpX
MSDKYDMVVQTKEEPPVWTPKLIYEELSQYVIGQDHAKKILSVAAYNHYKRMEYKEYQEVCPDLDSTELQKSNVLIMGTTGSGKTLLVKSLAKILDVPLYTSDATKFTEAGYVGGDVEDCIKGLLGVAKNDVGKAEFGIVMIDEADKLAGNTSSGKDVGGEGVQQALLAVMEGIDVVVHNSYSSKTLNTTNILFILCGAFSGIDKIVEKRVHKTQKTMGFGSELLEKTEETTSDLISQVIPSDLVVYGMIPELIGRVPIKAKLHSLDEEMLVRILTEPKDAVIKQYELMFFLDNTILEFDKGALGLIAKTAIEQNTGARGLRTIIEDIMLPIMFELPLNVDDYVITEEMVTCNLKKG